MWCFVGSACYQRRNLLDNGNWFAKTMVEWVFMEFCSECGSRMVPKKIDGSSLLQLVCSKCNKTVKDFAKLPSDQVRVINHSPKQLVAVVDRNENLSVLPTIDMECPRCENNKAFVWQVQTRGNDESSTQFMRCTKCNYTFRETSWQRQGKCIVWLWLLCW